MPYKLPIDSWLTRGILVLVGGIALAVSAGEFYGDWRFAREARTVQGTVIGKDVRTTTSRRRGSGVRSRTEHYEVTYRFTADGATIEGRDELTRDAWDRVTPRAPIGVLFLPDHPSSNRLNGPRPWATKTILGLLGLAFTAGGIAVSIRAVRRRRLEARLREQGLGARGAVTD
jgi:hypothetical protein